MKFGMFIEQTLPRPWSPDDEHRLVHEALEQIELADRLGFDCVWIVEHHFLEEYSHSSAPEVLLAAASQRTNRIRLGHGIMQLPPPINHPFRVAERIASLDLVSNGRGRVRHGRVNIGRRARRLRRRPRREARPVGRGDRCGGPHVRRRSRLRSEGRFVNLHPAT